MFGGATAGTFSLANLNGANGFIIKGGAPNDAGGGGAGGSYNAGADKAFAVAAKDGDGMVSISLIQAGPPGTAGAGDGGSALGSPQDAPDYGALVTAGQPTSDWFA